MVRFLGLTHLSLAVRDPERSCRFYAAASGARECYRDEDTIHAVGPAGTEILAFERDPARAGKEGGIGHFGFRLRDPGDLDAAIRAVQRAGGTLDRRGEFGPGMPYAYVRDPDGYEIEIWYEALPAPPPGPPASG